MGGRALKNTETRRYNRDEFETVSQELLEVLRKDFMRAELPLFYNNKETFGDADVILSMENFKRNMRAYIEDTFEPNEIFHNGNCWSFDYKELQVDLITCAGDDFDSNFHYLAFNDLGNFIGRLAQSFGLKYGQEGLWYNHYFKNQKVGKIMVSKDYPRIFEFLGLDYSRWEQGFDDLTDIFEYAASSPYFDAESFQLKNLDRINRERNLKRASYMSLLEWIDDNASDRVYKFEENKATYLKQTEAFFPESRLTLHIRELEFKHCRKEYFKAKFSGGMLMERYGLEGKAIGEAMEGFKNYIGKDSFTNFILENNMGVILLNFEVYRPDLISDKSLGS